MGKPILSKSRLMQQLPLPFGTATTMIYRNLQTGDEVEIRTPVPMQPIERNPKRRALPKNPTVHATVKKRTPKTPTGKKSKTKTPSQVKVKKVAKPARR